MTNISQFRMNRLLPQFVATGTAALGALGLGLVAGYTSTAIPDMKLSQEFMNLSNESYSWIGSFAPIGAFASGPVAGTLVGAIGRKGTMLLVSPLFILGWLLIGFALNIEMVYAGRFLTGFGGGTFSLVVPVYVSEIAESSIRGTLGSSLQLMINLGVTFAYIIGYFVNWWILALISSGVPALFLLVMLFMPESPNYLMQKKDKIGASKALKWLRGTESHDDVSQELNEMQITAESFHDVSLRDYARRGVLLPIGISLALMLFQQWNGNNAIVFYTVSIFQDAGTTIDPNVATIIVGSIQVLASILAAIMMDKAGRRVLLLISGVFMMVSLAVMGGFFQMKTDAEGGDISDIGWLPLACLIVFVISFSLGFGPIAWLLAGEILPSNVRGTASALATSFNWLNAFVVTKAFDNIQISMGTQWCFWIFAIVTAVGNCFVLVFVPETKGKTLGEIQALFD